MSRGKSEASLAITDAAVEILQREPTSVRGVCYALCYVYHLIESMGKKWTDKVSGLIRDARLNGIIPWEWILDDTRSLERISAWTNLVDFYREAPGYYRRDRWATQPREIQLWSEKATIKGWLRAVIDEYQLPVLITHGNTSWTHVEEAARHSHGLKAPLLALYVGDFDPSGMYMSEVDLPKRLGKLDANIEVRRIALTREDGEMLPPWDFREKRNQLNDWFARSYGGQAWELDAMSPQALRERVREAVLAEIDQAAWARAERAERRELKRVRADLLVLEMRETR